MVWLVWLVGLAVIKQYHPHASPSFLKTFNSKKEIIISTYFLFETHYLINNLMLVLVNVIKKQN